jgi:hypothetical protein
MLDLSFNFFRYLVSKSWHDQCLWGGAAQVRCNAERPEQAGFGAIQPAGKAGEGSGHSTWLLTVHLRYLCAVKGTVRPSALIVGAEREGECLSSPQHHTHSSCQQG